MRKLYKSVINLLAIGACTSGIACSTPFPQASQPTTSTSSESSTASALSKSTSTSTANTTTVPITLAKYDSLTLGMSYEQVKAALGEPNAKNVTEIQGLPITTAYTWTNPDYSMVSLAFQNNQLALKSQYNIK